MDGENISVAINLGRRNSQSIRTIVNYSISTSTGNRGTKSCIENVIGFASVGSPDLLPHQSSASFYQSTFWPSSSGNFYVRFLYSLRNKLVVTKKSARGWKVLVLISVSVH